MATQPPGESGGAAGPAPGSTRVELAAGGEILVSGPTVSPAVADGTLATGDLGELAADGTLHVIGRKSDTIISGGENVAPSEVESVLEEHPAVVEAAVYGVGDERWGEAVHALVVVRGRDQRRRSCGRTAPSASAASRCPKRSPSATRCRAPRRASCSEPRCRLTAAR